MARTKHKSLRKDKNRHGVRPPRKLLALRKRARRAGRIRLIKGQQVFTFPVKQAREHAKLLKEHLLQKLKRSKRA